MRSIVIDAPVGQPHSFGAVSTSISVELVRLGFKVYLSPWPTDYTLRFPPELEDAPRLPEGQRVDVALRVSHPDSFFIQDNKADVTYGLTAWETAVLPADFKGPPSGVNGVHHLFVPSRFNFGIYAATKWMDIDKLHLFPHGYDPSSFKWVDRRGRIGSRTFEFLWLATWTPRKRPDIAMKAFHEAFPKGSYVVDGITIDVRLKMAGTPPYDATPAEDLAKKPGIQVLPTTERTVEDLAKVYGEADAFVFPTMAEGFGMTVLEAMATGLPALVTDHSGVQDFCDPDVCILVPPARLMPIAGLGDGCAAQVSTTTLASIMRGTVANRLDSIELGRRASERVKQKWTWKHQVEQWANDFMCPLQEGRVPP